LAHFILQQCCFSDLNWLDIKRNVFMKTVMIKVALLVAVVGALSIAGGGIAAAAGFDRDDERACKCCRRAKCERSTK